MPRGIDHIVHAVRDLAAAAALYRGLGFTVGARNRHPPEWGTENHIVQLPGFFVELLSVTKPEAIARHGPRSFSFGAHNRDFLAQREGLSMLVLSSDNGARDAAAFRAAGIGDFAVFDFAREARRPDGAAVKVAFSLAFARDGAAPEIGFFVCQQHYPENFWNPAFQKHANSATSLAGVVAVADEPEWHRTFLQSFAGSEATHAEGGFRIATARGVIEMVTPKAFTARFGVAAPDVTRSARLAAIRITLADASLLQNAPELSGIAGIYAGNAAIIGANDAMGVVIVFEPAR